MRRKNSGLLWALLGIIILALLVVLGFYRCPLRMIFGIPCPLCGITRAFLSLCTGHFAQSFYYHPLWPVVIIIAVVFVLSRKDIIHLSSKQIKIGEIIIGVLLIACFIIRHIMHSPVVAIHFDESLIYSFVKPFLS